MERFSEGTLQEMAKEDPWLGSVNAQVLLSLVQPGENNPATLESVIEFADADTADPAFEKSAALHYFQAGLYESLPYQLSGERRRAIELSKLERRGVTDLSTVINMLNMSPAEIGAALADREEHIPLKSLNGLTPQKRGSLYSILNPGKEMRGEGEETIAINPVAATVYAKLCSIRVYRNLGNAARVFFHLTDALRLSGRHNPTVFKNLIEPAAASYISTMIGGAVAVQLSTDIISGVFGRNMRRIGHKTVGELVTTDLSSFDHQIYDAIGRAGTLVEEMYHAAKARVEGKAEVITGSRLLPPLSTERPAPF